MEKKQFLSPREGVKVGNSDTFCKLLEKVRNFMVPDCTIPNNLNFFKHVANFPRKMITKSYNHFGPLFYNDLTLRSAAAQILARAKKGILSLQTLIYFNLHIGNF